MFCKFLLDDTPNAHGLYEIYIYTHNAEPRTGKYYATNLYTEKESWDAKTERISETKGVCSENMKLSLLEKRVKEHTQDFSDAFRCPVFQYVNYLEWDYFNHVFDLYRESLTSEKEKDLLGSLLYSCKNKDKYGLLTWLRTIAFIGNCVEEQNLQHLKRFAKVLKFKQFHDWTVENNYFPDAFGLVDGISWRTSTYNPKSGVLEPAEIQRILTTQPANENGKLHKNLFLFSLFEGVSIESIIDYPIIDLSDYDYLKNPFELTRWSLGLIHKCVSRICHKFNSNPTTDIHDTKLSRDMFMELFNASILSLCQKLDIHRNIPFFTTLNSENDISLNQRSQQIILPSYLMLLETSCLIDVCDYFITDKRHKYAFFPESLTKRIKEFKALVETIEQM